MTLGDIIKQYREEHGLSMDAFARKSGISKAYISLLEKNRHPKTGLPIAPSIGTIKQAADGMCMDFNKLFSMVDSAVDISPTSFINWNDDAPAFQASEQINSPVSTTLRPDEQTLLRGYNKLNDSGKERVLDYVDDLVGNVKYTEEKLLDSENAG